MHLNTVNVEEGNSIKEGQEIGTIGKSGFGKQNQWAAHLHYELRLLAKNGKYISINPESERGSLIDPQLWITNENENVVRKTGLNIFMGQTYLSPSPETSIWSSLLNTIKDFFRKDQSEPDADFWMRYANEKENRNL